MKTRKMLVGGLLSKGIKMIYKDPASKKALRKLTELGREVGASRFDINTQKARGLKKYVNLINKKIAQGQGSKDPTFKKKATKVMTVAKNRLNLFLKEQKAKKEAMIEGKKVKKNFKGGLMIQPKLAKRGY